MDGELHGALYQSTIVHIIGDGHKIGSGAPVGPGSGFPSFGFAHPCRSCPVLQRISLRRVRQSEAARSMGKSSDNIIGKGHDFPDRNPTCGLWLVALVALTVCLVAEDGSGAGGGRRRVEEEE